jgi:hypothetical protein
LPGTTGVTGFIIDDCTFVETNAPTSTITSNAPVAFGLGLEGSVTRDVTVRSSTFTQRDASPEHWDLVLLQVEGALIENCIFDNNSTGRDAQGNPIIDGASGLPIKSGNIRIGYGSFDGSTDLSTTDVIIRDCLMLGPSQTGIWSDNGANKTPNARITVESCSITATEVGIEFNNTVSSNIVNSRVKDVLGSPHAEGIGIHFSGPLPYNPTAATDLNEISGSSITNNTYGIVLDCGSTYNLIDHNRIFKNRKCQVSRLKKDNALVRNIILGKHKTCHAKLKQRTSSTPQAAAPKCEWHNAMPGNLYVK